MTPEEPDLVVCLPGLGSVLIRYSEGASKFFPSSASPRLRGEKDSHMSRIGDETVASFDHGRKSGVGTSATPLVATALHAAKGIELIAAATNSGTVYVGNADVTAGAADATDGFPLAPGARLFLPLDDPSKVYVRGSAAGQTVFFVVL
jgi:hypothetical protein